jgi:hypothetical protein
MGLDNSQKRSDTLYQRTIFNYSKKINSNLLQFFNILLYLEEVQVLLSGALRVLRLERPVQGGIHDRLVAGHGGRHPAVGIQEYEVSLEFVLGSFPDLKHDGQLA